MSEEKKQQNPEEKKGGAHVAKAGSTVSAQAAGNAGTGVAAPGGEPPKRNKYADKMNKKKSRLSKGVRIGIGVAVIVLLIALVFIVALVVLLKDNPDILEKVLYTLGGVITGAFGGYGIGKNARDD